jgi:class 3 adenylate cyclase/cytochrome c-type biogenesis protein CcmH/NrfG
MAFDAILANRTEIDAELRKHKSPVTVMFTDLAGSTAFFARHGDTVGLRWIEEHNRLVVPCVERHQGTVVKTIGDSVMAYFTDPGQAVTAASEIQQSIQEANKERTEGSEMQVRVALHQGLGYLRGGDVFGDVVNVAARLAKACQPAQVLVSEAVYLSLPAKASARLRGVGDVEVRGKSSAAVAYEVLWTDESLYDKLRSRLSSLRPATATAGESGGTIDPGGGRYVILSELGRGAMGVVYRAYDSAIGRVVALKTIPLEVEGAEREALVERLKHEAHTAGMLDHPNIVTVFDVGEEAGLFYLTMQNLEGRTLAQVKESGDLLPLETVFDIADQTCAAVSFAHSAGIVHRDLKPSNLMLTTGGVVKVMDFGIAKFGDTGLTRAGMVLGTPSYLSPEQAGGRRIDARSDIFSLGAVLYELFTGERAFPGDSATAVVYKILHEEPIPPRAVEPAISGALNAVLLRALARDPEQRFQTCDELRQALRDCRTGTGLGPPKPLPAEKTESAAGRRASPWLIAAATALAVLLGAGLVWKYGGGETAAPDGAALGAAPRFDKGEDLLRYVQAMRNTGRIQLAFPALEDYLARHPEDMDVRLSYASMLGFDRNFNAALSEYRKVLEREPKNLEALIGVARVTSWQENHPAALALYDDVLRQHPDNYDALVGKAFTLLWIGRKAEALPLFRQAAERNPQDAEVANAIRLASEE